MVVVINSPSSPSSRKRGGLSSNSQKTNLIIAILLGVVGILLLLSPSFSDYDEYDVVDSTKTTILKTTTSTPPTSMQYLSSSYKLAYEQSFGFFDDIPDHQWIRAQEIHMKMFPNTNKKDKDGLYKFSSGIDNKDPKFKSSVQQSSKWYGNNFHPEFHCPLQQRLPTDGDIDGPKWVCDPHRLRNVTDCLVYSFGSNGKAEFEMGVHDEIGTNCEIHTFDPVSYNKRNGHFAIALKGYAKFHNWGLGTKKDEMNPKSKVKTLETTMKQLGHINRTIHIFKIDCEWCEWFNFRQFLKQDIRQILVETHNAPMPHGKQFFEELHDQGGYVIFNKEANYENGGGAVEYAFLKLHTDFFQGKLYNTDPDPTKNEVFLPPAPWSK